MADLDSLDAIFKAYDVRGVVPDQIDAALCERIGAAFARFAADGSGTDRVLVARDMRASGSTWRPRSPRACSGRGSTWSTWAWLRPT